MNTKINTLYKQWEEGKDASRVKPGWIRKFRFKMAWYQANERARQGLARLSIATKRI